jgi:hypothetical protein
VLFDYSPPRHNTASFLTIIGDFTDAQCQRFKPLADKDIASPMKQRLYDIIDRNRDGHITADELQTALQLPAHAQAISQMVLRKESEWFYTKEKWDGLDELLGHCGSTPELNWVAEKQRIEQLGWWSEVAERVGLPSWGRPYHFHPVGLVGTFKRVVSLIDVKAFLSAYGKAHTLFSVGTPVLSFDSSENLKKILIAINSYYETSTVEPNLFEVSYMLATARHETYYFPKAEYFSEKPEVGSPDYFNKYDSVLANSSEHRERARRQGNALAGDGYKYRGRGCVHLTWKNNYRKFSELLSFDFVSNPDEAAKFEYSVPIMIVGMTNGLFTGKKLNHYFNPNGVDYKSARKIINGSDKAELIASYAERFERILKETSTLPEGF